MVEGTGHYFVRWREFGYAETLCHAVAVYPRQVDFREPDPNKRERECRRCTDWKGDA
jgi:hypothetical protein